MSKTYIALDVETTGLNPEHDAIIEIGVVKFAEDRVLAEWSNLVNPHRPLPYKIQQLTGINPGQLEEAPSLRSLMPDLQDFVRDLPIVGHNIAFDLSFFRQQGCFLNNPSIDTFELASILMPHASRYSLSMLTAELGIALPNAHRALHDARAARNLFLALLERVVDMDLKTLQEINRLAAPVDWPLKTIFRDVERTRSRHAFGSSIGDQLRQKGLLDGKGFTRLFSSDEEETPLRRSVTRQMIDIDQLAATLSSDGAFAQKFPGYEYRPQQVAMLRAVAESFNNQQHLMIEAGTGTGKSLAYLLPAMHFAAANGERVVISTNTINLQDQLYKKDVPDLQSLLPFEVKTVLLKGRSNYLCLRRLAAFRQRTDLLPEDLTMLAKVLAWLPSTVTGDQSELFLPDPRQRARWSQINASADQCTAEQCTYRQQGRCFFYRARGRAENAHLIIVNHALLLADVAVDNRALPEYRYLIVDEAHHLEASTTSQLTNSLTENLVPDLAVALGISSTSSRHGGLLAEITLRTRSGLPRVVSQDVDAYVKQIAQEAEGALRTAQEVFDSLRQFLTSQVQDNEQPAVYGQKVRLTPASRLQPNWTPVEVAAENLCGHLAQAHKKLEQLRAGLSNLEEHRIPDLDELLEEMMLQARRWYDTLNLLNTMIMEPDNRLIYWVEIPPGNERTSIHATPLHVGELVQKHLLSPKEAVIMTSATLTSDNQFDFIQERLGASDVSTVAVGSPFDFERSTLIWIPTDIPEPRQPFHQKAVEDVLRKVSLALGGRTMALFTSYTQLRSTARAIAADLEEQEIILYEQGDGTSRHQLLESFKTSPRAVLLGTRSFWEGVDIAGEALSCLVLVRLPFAVPTDPIVAARSETFEDPFQEYSLPDAILRFRQGFGRLIRSKSDRGVVIILDRRILNKSYGQAFLDSLPTCTVRKGPAGNLPGEVRRWIAST